MAEPMFATNGVDLINSPAASSSFFKTTFGGTNLEIIYY